MSPEKHEAVENEFEVISGGVVIRGFYYAPDAPGRYPVVAILHGIPRAKPSGTDSSYKDMAGRFAEHGFLAITFNFRGTGISDGNISMEGWKDDLAAMLDFCRALPSADPGRVALLGFSAGGSVAIRQAAEDQTVGALVSASSPARYDFLEKTMPADKWVALFKEIGLIRDPDFPVSIEEWEAEFDEAAPIRFIGRVTAPTLIIHGESDEVIPLEHAHELFEAAGGPKELRIIPDGAHRLRVDERVVKMALEWLVEWKNSAF